MRAVIWGCGGTTKDFLRKKILCGEYEIIAFVDNNSKLWGTCFYNRIEVLSPKELQNIKYDIIIICSLYMEQIKKQLIEELHISEKQIITYKDLEQNICNQLIEKYKDDEDKEMKKVLKEYEKGNLNILGYYAPEIQEYHTVYRDEEQFPYILFEGKRMYYPKDYVFIQKEGKEVVPDVLYEQGKESPHLYVQNENQIPDGAIIVDAGVCEGNFALRYVERAKKIYLIEADKRWMEALQRTFKKYSDKVVFCEKFLSGHDNKNEITLDKLVEEQIDFLKMDIEGAEVEALLGAQDVLERSKGQCAICSYHRQYDSRYISHILNSFGYQTSYSKGYMFFSYDDNVVNTMDLRKGVVYGYKEN